MELFPAGRKQIYVRLENIDDNFDKSPSHQPEIPYIQLDALATLIYQKVNPTVRKYINGIAY